MIKFFRNIRRKLLAGNNSKKYVLYAIGEIVLVVIGILIALAINNANENHSLRQKEKTYLTGLQQEFQTSKAKLEELLLVNRTNYEGAEEIVRDITTSTDSLSEIILSRLLFDSFSRDIAFNPNNSLLQEMINSGSLRDLSDESLRARLTNWIASLEDIAKQEHDLMAQRENVLDFFRTDAYSMKTIFDHTGTSAGLDLPKTESPLSNLGLLQSTAFENHLLIFILTSRAMEKEHYEPLMIELDSLLALLGNEIR